MSITCYKELIVWQKAMMLTRQIYHSTKHFPPDEQYGLTSQIRRSAVSVPSNIAEGYGRGSNKDFSRFLKIARGSLFELQTQNQIALDLNYLTDQDYQIIEQLSDEVSKMLRSLINKLDTA